MKESNIGIMCAMPGGLKKVEVVVVTIVVVVVAVCRTSESCGISYVYVNKYCI